MLMDTGTSIDTCLTRPDESEETLILRDPNPTPSKTHGFSVVELIVVILLLCFLAVTTLPRILDDGEATHDAAFAGTVAGFKTGLALYHAQWIRDGQPPAGTPLENFAGLRATPQGYPHGVAERGANVPGSGQDCADILDRMLHQGKHTAVVEKVEELIDHSAQYVAMNDGSNCHYYYLGRESQSGATVPMFSYVTGTGSLATGNFKLP